MERGTTVGNLTFTFKVITYDDVLIMEKWAYNGFEKSLFMDSYHESHKKGDNPILGPGSCKGFSVFIGENKLFGIFEYYFEADGVYIGLAINPKYVGRGYSKEFILSGLRFAKGEYGVEDFKLAVHRKNIQAIKAYEKTGFTFVKKVDDELYYKIKIED